MKSSRSTADLQVQVEELRSEALSLKKSQNQLLQEAAMARIRERKLQDELRRAGTPSARSHQQRDTDEMNRALQAELDRVRKRNSALQEQVRKFADGARKTPRLRRKTPRRSSPPPLSHRRADRNENTVVDPDEIQVLLDRLGHKLAVNPTDDLPEPPIKPNSELIELKARLRDSQTKVLILERQYDQLEAALQAGKQVQRSALDQIDHYKALLTDANGRCRQAQSRVKELEFAQDQVDALQLIIDDLKATNTNLQTQIDTLTQTAFLGDQTETRRLKALEADHQARVGDLRAVLAQRDADLSAATAKAQEQGDRIRALGDELAHVQGQCARAERAERQAQIRLDDLQERLDAFTAESGIDLDVLHGALDLVRRQGSSSAMMISTATHHEPVTIGALQRRIRDLEILNKDLVEDIRNKDDVLRIQARLHADLDASYNRLLEEHGRLKQSLDHERHQMRIHPRPESVLSDLSLLSQASLTSIDGDRNLIAIRVIGATLDRTGPRFRNAPDPLTFVTIDFFDFETCYSGVFAGYDPSYRLTAQFRADLDPLLFTYLQSGSMTIDLYRQAAERGHAADLLGRCRLGLSDLLQYGQRLRGIFPLLDLADANLQIGTVQIVAKMYRPVMSPTPSVVPADLDDDDTESQAGVVPEFVLRLTLALLHVPVTDAATLDLHVRNAYYDLDTRAERISAPGAPSPTFSFECRSRHDQILPHEIIDLHLIRDGIVVAVAQMPLAPVTQSATGLDDLQLALYGADGARLGAGTVRLDWALLKDV